MLVPEPARPAPIVDELDDDDPAVEVTLDGVALLAARKPLAGKHPGEGYGQPSGDGGIRV